MADKIFSGWDINRKRIKCLVANEEDRDRIIRIFRSNKKIVKITADCILIWKR